MAQTRGSFGFEIGAAGGLRDTPANVENLRRLWLDRSLINGNDLGPGDPGDFDHGAWHVACHVVAAGGVRRARSGDLLWLALSYDAASDEYYAGMTFESGGTVQTRRLDSAEGTQVLQGSKLLGFVEGNSVGHISARGVSDPLDLFNRWTRQRFDRPADSRKDGGKVWEHWCTVRDIRPSQRIASSVLKAYVTLMAALGDRFIAAVARGRRSYGHPRQLCAMVRGGVTTAEAALWNIKPEPIPGTVERKFLEARPQDELEGCSSLPWSDEPRYYMFKRRIRSWSAAASVRADLASFPA